MTVVKEPVRIHVGVPKPNLAPSIQFDPKPVEVEVKERELVPVKQTPKENYWSDPRFKQSKTF